MRRRPPGGGGRGLPRRDRSRTLGRHVLPEHRPRRPLPSAILDLEHSRQRRQPRQADPPLCRPLPTPLTTPTRSRSSSPLPGADSLEPHLDALQAAGCDDAGIHGPGRRRHVHRGVRPRGPSFPGAVVSALDALRSALPDVELLRVQPEDIVSLSAIAARTGRTDESVRLLGSGPPRPGGFPPAAGRINEKTQVWRWADVARWFSDALGEPPAGQRARRVPRRAQRRARPGRARGRPAGTARRARSGAALPAEELTAA